MRGKNKKIKDILGKEAMLNKIAVAQLYISHSYLSYARWWVQHAMTVLNFVAMESIYLQIYSFW